MLPLKTPLEKLCLISCGKLQIATVTSLDACMTTSDSPACVWLFLSPVTRRIRILWWWQKGPRKLWWRCHHFRKFKPRGNEGPLFTTSISKMNKTTAIVFALEHLAHQEGSLKIEQINLDWLVEKAVIKMCDCLYNWSALYGSQVKFIAVKLICSNYN